MLWRSSGPIYSKIRGGVTEPSEYQSMLVQAGSFQIPFSLFKTVVTHTLYIYLSMYLRKRLAEPIKIASSAFLRRRN